MPPLHRTAWLAAVLLFVACTADEPDSLAYSSVGQPTHAALVDPEVAEAEAAVDQTVAAYRSARTAGEAFSLLELDDGGERAREVFLDSPFGRESARQIAEGNFLVEFFSIVQPNAGDVDPTVCPDLPRCRRIELYDYTNHATLTAYVDLAGGTVTEAFAQPGVVPDIPPHLIDVAVILAKGSTAVQQEAYEYGVVADGALMAATKTDLNESRCERQEHLCVAPTFTNDEGAVWAIVDLTELRVAGVAWTRVEDNGGEVPVEPVTLRRAEEALIQTYCDERHELAEGPWTAGYQLTSSDGLHITDLRFEGRLVATSIKLVDWHVAYSLNDGFGYSDAVGCPAFAQAAVVAADVPVVRDLDNDGMGTGISLDQDYWSENWPDLCSYNYRQSLRLYDDGTFRPVATSQGKGCGDTGVYRPVFRIALPPDLSTIDEGAVDSEQWLHTEPGRSDFQLGSDYRLDVPSEPLADDEQDYPAWVYFTQGARAAEGASELVTIGPCCNTDHRQGPEQFVDGEALDGTDTVVWVVPELHNDPTEGQQACWVETVIDDDGVRRNVIAPCSAGPLFRPVAS